MCAGQRAARWRQRGARSNILHADCVKGGRSGITTCRTPSPPGSAQPRPSAPSAEARPPLPRPEVRSACARPPARTDADAPLGDPGVTLLGTLIAAMLSIVAMAWIVAAVGRWWVLIPVMAVSLTLTAIVLLVMVRLLDDGE